MVQQTDGNVEFKQKSLPKQNKMMKDLGSQRQMIKTVIIYV